MCSDEGDQFGSGEVLRSELTDEDRCVTGWARYLVFGVCGAAVRTADEEGDGWASWA